MRKLTGVHEECGVFGIYDMDGENVCFSQAIFCVQFDLV